MCVCVCVCACVRQYGKAALKETNIYRDLADTKTTRTTRRTTTRKQTNNMKRPNKEKTAKEASLTDVATSAAQHGGVCAV